MNPRRNGFTLIELLVVISIIALLISILLPSLGKARQSARDLTCATNLKSIGQALAVYATDYKGWWPKAAGNLPGQPGNTAPRDLWHRVALYPRIYDTTPDPTGVDNTYAYLKKTVFECPAATLNWDQVTASDISYGMAAQLTYTRGSNSTTKHGGPDKYKKITNLNYPSQTATVMDDNMPWAGTGLTPTSYSAGAAWQADWNDQWLALQRALVRHNNRINVVFFDGHASPVNYENIPLPGGTRLVADVNNPALTTFEFYRFWTGTE